MLPEFGTEEYTEYLDKIVEGKIKHKYYDEAVKHARAMSVHTEGTLPKDILNKKRPREDEEIKKYRLDSWEPETKGTAEKVIAVVNRIYNKRLFNIQWKDNPKRIPEDESLEHYLTEGMPVYKSLMKFITDVFTKKDFTDPNSVIFVEPISYDVDETEYLRPIPKVYFAKTVLDFEDWRYFTIQKSEEELCIVDTETVRYFKKKKGKKTKWEFDFQIEHKFGYPPVFRSGGIVLKTEYPLMYQSFIAGVLPHWNKAIGWISDIDGSITNTLHPEKWEFTVDCEAEGCKGGKVSMDTDMMRIVPEGAENSVVVNCRNCQGSGKIAVKSPFHVYQINRDAINPEAPIPTPPFGYADKETGSIELLDKFIEKQIHKGLYAINMDIVTKVGENQSGISKTIDRTDLDSFLQQISSHVFGVVIPFIVDFTTLWRYSKILSEKEMKDMIPTIEEPTAFDVLSLNYLLDELQNVTNAGLSSAISIGIQKDIIEKRFTSEKQKKRLKTIIELDPLPGKKPDEILAAISERVVSKRDYYIHEHIISLVDELSYQNDKFLDLTYMEKVEKIKQLAEDKLKEGQPDIMETDDGGEL